MKWTIFCCFLAICDYGFGAVTVASERKSDTLIVDPAPFENSTEPVSDDNSENQLRDVPIKYDGSQLWRIGYSTQGMKNAVLDLQDRFGASMWNLNADETVDMMMRYLKIDEAQKLLEQSNVPYEILISDLQRAMDEENPSLEEIDLWENRNGKCSLNENYCGTEVNVEHAICGDTQPFSLGG